jgi:hypothetical protein
MDRYSIYLARIPFKDSAGEKIRPVLVIGDMALLVDCIYITSKAPQTKFDYQITNYKESGLTLPSVICTNKRYHIRHEDLKRKIGQLHRNDVALLKIKFYLP